MVAEVFMVMGGTWLKADLRAVWCYRCSTVDMLVDVRWRVERSLARD